MTLTFFEHPSDQQGARQHTQKNHSTCWIYINPNGSSGQTNTKKNTQTTNRFPVAFIRIAVFITIIVIIGTAVPHPFGAAARERLRDSACAHARHERAHETRHKRKRVQRACACAYLMNAPSDTCSTCACVCLCMCLKGLRTCAVVISCVGCVRARATPVSISKRADQVDQVGGSDFDRKKTRFPVPHVRSYSLFFCLLHVRRTSGTRAHSAISEMCGAQFVSAPHT